MAIADFWNEKNIVCREKTKAERLGETVIPTKMDTQDLKKKTGKGHFAIVLYKKKKEKVKSIFFSHGVKAQVERNIGHCCSNRNSTAKDES